MKRILGTTCAIAFSVVLPLQAAAQQSGPPLLPGETAQAYAVRVNACGGAELLGAQFGAGGDVVQARCASAGMGMGQGPAAAAAAAAGVGVLLIIALDGSSSTTTSN
ncbi:MULTISPECIES: hypothetical protein [unclassified Roseovarius]|uniref:hypothetical protein n=1 Tax=unclassified Roseovarius TaxID=2614913 RepID=UPI001267DEA0|nr:MULTISPECIES: hypothetical protein [unclassified Roseovarius]